MTLPRLQFARNNAETYHLIPFRQEQLVYIPTVLQDLKPEVGYTDR